MSDDFSGHASGLDSPFTGGQDVTPSDSVALNKTTRSLWIGTAGSIRVLTKDGSTLNFANFSGWMPGRIERVNATGTTASNITAVW